MTLVKKLAKLVLKYPLRLINSIYTRSYYSEGLKSLGWKIDEISKDENVLIIAPHVDDETIGLGGTLIKHRNLGFNGTLVYVADGSGAVSNLSEEDLINVRKEEARKIASIYGIEDLYFLDHKDCNVNFKDQKSVDKILKILKELNPDRIYTPFLLDGHVDHINSTKLLLRALSIWNRSFDNIWMYEVNTPNDLRIINRVISLNKKEFKEKEQMYKYFKSQGVMGFDAYSLLDKRKALLTKNINTYAAEVFIKLSLETASEVSHMLEEEGFRPDMLRQLSSQYNMMLAFLKNSRLKRKFNNYLNFILKEKIIEGEIQNDKGFI